MEKTRLEGIKKAALAAFLFVSITLIIFTWVHGALDLAQDAPGFYRQPTLAIEYDYRDFLSDSDHEDHGEGGGGGGGGGGGEGNNAERSTPAPAATTDWDAVEDDQ